MMYVKPHEVDKQICYTVRSFIIFTPWNRVLLEKLIVARLVKKFRAFYGTKDSLPCSQDPATGPCPEPD
jgi:hypothetical protein